MRTVTDPSDLTLVELLPLLDARTLSARELLDACLARIDQHEAAVGAFVVRTPELALAAAEQADAARASGQPVGPLAGVPVALKDLVLTRGVPTTASSRVLAGHDPGIDATLWTRLARAGAGLVGKTVLHEFAYGTGSVPTCNPWDLTRTPGGSSGGSAAALAARMVPVATGTDTGGSLRIPAAACGVSSLRPAQGRVSSYGVLALSPSMDTAGPMARRMLDVSLLLRLLAGHDPLLLERRGAVLVDVAPPPGTDEVMGWPGTYGDTMGPEALLVHATWLAEREHLYGEEVLGRLRHGGETTPARYAAAQQDRRRWTQDWRLAFQALRLDAVAHPTNPQPPQVLPARGPSISPSKAWSITGFPCLSVPVGVDDLGLPVGLSLAALPEQEAALVGLGTAVDEDVQLWRRNPLAGP